MGLRKYIRKSPGYKLGMRIRTLSRLTPYARRMTLGRKYAPGHGKFHHLP